MGNLTIVQKDATTTAAVKSQLTLIVRTMYSNPPAFGARIVDTVLNDPALHAEWFECLKIMSSRIIKMRRALYDELVRLGTPGTWNHIIDQIGMFSYTGLNGETKLHQRIMFWCLSTETNNFLYFIAEKQVLLLIDRFHIYLLKTGRISMSGLNENNVAYVANAIHTAVTTIPN